MIRCTSNRVQDSFDFCTDKIFEYKILFIVVLERDISVKDSFQSSTLRI